MGHSKAEKDQSRERILDAAATQIGKHGMDSLGVAEIMRSAGLTAGAFYGHFASRDDLVAQAARRVMSMGQERVDAALATSRRRTLNAFLDAYFDETHIRDSSVGCGICALVGEGRFAPDLVREVIAEQYDTSVRQVSALLGERADAESLSQGIMASIVGAVNLARAVPDEKRAKAILDAARRQILQAAR